MAVSRLSPCMEANKAQRCHPHCSAQHWGKAHCSCAIGASSRRLQSCASKVPPSWHPERRDCCSQNTEICSATRDGSAASTHGVLQQLLASSSPQPCAKRVGPKGHLSEPGRISKDANPPSFDCTLCRATYKAPKGAPCWNLPASTKCSVLKVCSHSPAVCKQTCTLAGRVAAQRCLFAHEGGNSELREESCVCCGVQSVHTATPESGYARHSIPAEHVTCSCFSPKRPLSASRAVGFGKPRGCATQRRVAVRSAMEQRAARSHAEPGAHGPPASATGTFRMDAPGVFGNTER